MKIFFKLVSLPIHCIWLWGVDEKQTHSKYEQEEQESNSSSNKKKILKKIHKRLKAEENVQKMLTFN